MASVADNLARLASCNILVVGDVMLDRYWFGAVERISPEAPVPVVRVDSREHRLGGAGNVACNITALGGQCTLVAVVGDDEAGAQVETLAAHAGVARQWVVDDAMETTLKLRVLARHQQLLRADFESRPTARALDALGEKFDELLPSHDAVVLSDYGKGGLARVENLIDAAAKKNVAVLVDPKGDFARYRGAATVTPNLTEFEQVAGKVADDADMQAKATELMSRHKLQKLLVTLSERGMKLFSRDGVLHAQARAREVYDVSGAGDSVIAVMAMAAAVKLDDDIALQLANAVAGQVVSKLGTATADLDALKAALAEAK